jgi:hypothetical protein
MIFEKIKDLIANLKFQGIYYEGDKDPNIHVDVPHPFNPFPDGSLLFDVIVLIQLCFLLMGYCHVVGCVVRWCFDFYDQMRGKQTFRRGEIL